MGQAQMGAGPYRGGGGPLQKEGRGGSAEGRGAGAALSLTWLRCVRRPPRARNAWARRRRGRQPWAPGARGTSCSGGCAVTWLGTASGAQHSAASPQGAAFKGLRAGVHDSLA